MLAGSIMGAKSPSLLSSVCIIFVWSYSMCIIYVWVGGWICPCNLPLCMHKLLGFPYTLFPVGTLTYIGDQSMMPMFKLMLVTEEWNKINVGDRRMKQIMGGNLTLKEA